jgi:pyridoxal phosphate enzyme (YggS family)
LKEIRQNVERLRERIAEAALRCGREPESVELVAAAKGVGAERVEEAIACGIKIVGENRVQEAAVKKASVSGQAEWHMIGHLQTNKVKKGIELFCAVQSVDSIHLAREISRRAGEAGKTIEVLLEVNTSGEESKFGVSPRDVVRFAGEVRELANLNLRGLMTIGLYSDEPEEVRPCFRILTDLGKRLTDRFENEKEMEILSMGMTTDFETAIEEGSTMVRIGTGLFGSRTRA